MRMGRILNTAALLASIALLMVMAGRAPAEVLYNSYGFESSAGYVANLPLAGQPATGPPLNQWLEAQQGLNNPGYPAAEVVAYVPPGPPTNQQLVGVADNNIGPNDYGYWYPATYVTTPFTPSATNGTNVVNVAWTEAWLSGATGDPFFGITVSDGNDLLATGGVNADNGLLVVSNNTGTFELGSAFFQGTAGTYYNFNLELNYTTKTYGIYINGSLVDTENFATADSQFTDADITTYVLQTSQDATGDGYFDNYLITAVPEPGMLTLGGMAVFLLSVRKPREQLN